MILSRSSEYAIRAFLYLAKQEPGRLVMARQIAEDAQLPGHFLAKLLQQLARKGLVRSNKGPSGGFALATDPRDINILSIVEAVEGVDGGVEYAGARPAGGDGWNMLHSRIVDYLEQTSLADIAKTGNGSARKRKAAKHN
ncbi:MAG: Rrf2 family transcriptional regulator [Bryobacterales bacterium]|nr:Rrf2 family transcriptional regulator [Bryobacterales bacterium]